MGCWYQTNIATGISDLRCRQSRSKLFKGQKKNIVRNAANIGLIRMRFTLMRQKNDNHIIRRETEIFFFLNLQRFLLRPIHIG